MTHRNQLRGRRGGHDEALVKIQPQDKFKSVSERWSFHWGLRISQVPISPQMSADIRQLDPNSAWHNHFLDLKGSYNIYINLQYDTFVLLKHHHNPTAIKRSANPWEQDTVVWAKKCQSVRTSGPGCQSSQAARHAGARCWIRNSFICKADIFW